MQEVLSSSSLKTLVEQRPDGTGFPRVWPIRVPLVILDHKLHSFFFVNVLGMAVQFMGITLAAVHASSCNHFSQARLIFICPSQVGTTVHDSGSIRWMS